MDLQENLEQIRKNSEQMLWSGCGNCSRRKFYQIGYEDGLTNWFKRYSLEKID